MRPLLDIWQIAAKKSAMSDSRVGFDPDLAYTAGHTAFHNGRSLHSGETP